MEKTWIYAALLWAGLAVFTGKSAGEEKPTPAGPGESAAVSAPDIEGLSNRINDLAKTAKVGLLLQAQYLYSGFNGAGPKGFTSPVKISPVTGYPYSDLFTGKRAEISLFGDLAPNKIAYMLKYDPLGTTTAKPGVSNGEQLKDYYLKVSYVPYADVQFGQGKYPQGLEGRQPSGDLDFSNRALVVSALNDRRDLCFQVSGAKVPLGPLNLDYAAAIVQGSGQNAQDNNDNKDLAGRVGVDVAGTGLWLGASGYGGRESTVIDAYAAGGARDFTGFEGRWTYHGLKLQGEYLQGQLEPGNNYNPWAGISPATARESNPRGWYATASYRLGDWRLGIRGESFNPDTTAGSKYNVNNDVLTVGLDWFQAKDRFRLYVDFEEHYDQYEALLTQAEINL